MIFTDTKSIKTLFSIKLVIWIKAFFSLTYTSSFLFVIYLMQGIVMALCDEDYHQT